jgi:hypothetical protein
MNKRRRHKAKRNRKVRKLRQEAASVFYPYRRRALVKLRQMGVTL